MYQIDINNPVHIHFIGIGGISMSGLASLLHSKGFTVSGSDRSKSDITKSLSAEGIKLYYGQGAENITDDIDVVVYTAAIHPDNPEYAECVRRGLPMMDRAALLGQVCKFYKTAIGVAGTHGKTTTTSMISLILLEAKKDPTISVGGILPAIGGNLRIGAGEDFLFEACEYTNSFHKFFPTDEIILNVEADHLDFFKDLAEIRESFNTYAKLVPAYGCIVINAAIENYEEIVKNTSGKVITYGLANQCDASKVNYSATDITYDELGQGSYTLIKNGEKACEVKLCVPGEHNVGNSLAAIALCEKIGVELSEIVKGLAKFTGTDRRFQYKGEIGGIKIVDDYAHHPTEIKATLTAATKCDKHDLWVVFQPHTYTRTKALKEEFIEALGHAPHVVLAAIYAAREIDDGTISSKDIQDELIKMGVDAHYFPTFDEIENFLIKNLVNGDMLITMGAGDVVKIGEHLLGN